MDISQWALVTSIVSAIVLGLSAGYVAWQNAGSKNLPLAVAALIGVIVGFLIQLSFELTPSVRYESISAEFTIDRSIPSIRQWRYSDSGPVWRLLTETDASSWAAQNRPDAFMDREKLTNDFAIFSLVSFFARQEYDWQLQQEVFKGNVSGTFSRTSPVSTPDQCRIYRAEELQSLLAAGNNVFAGAPVNVFRGQLCLPPKTQLKLSDNTLTLTNPMCQISFQVSPSGAVSFVKPGDRNEAPQLPSGGAQFETRIVHLKVTTTSFALRAQHRDRKKYDDWATRVVNHARNWFENS